MNAVRKFWFTILDRHDDGSKHTWEYVTDLNLGPHDCGDYCHHYRTRCTGCGEERIMGDYIDEVR